jgi:hypothetical protein
MTAQEISASFESIRDKCPVCSKWFIKQKNGRIRRHVREIGGGTIFTELCPGSGRPPKQPPEVTA